MGWGMGAGTRGERRASLERDDARFEAVSLGQAAYRHALPQEQLEDLGDADLGRVESGGQRDRHGAARLVEAQIVDDPQIAQRGFGEGVAGDLDADHVEFARQLAEGALGEDAAAFEDGGAVAERFEFAQVVAGDEQRGAAFADGADEFAQLMGAFGVEAGGRFVEEDEFGRAEECLGNADPFGHAVREGAAGGFPRILESDAFQPAPRLAFGLGFGHALKARIEGERPSDRVFGRQKRVLGENANHAAQI